MLKLILAGIVGLIIIIALIIIIRNKPDLWFWIFLNLFFDPGGYVVGLLDGALVGSLNISDVFIVGITICLIFAKVNWKSIFQDKFLVRFLFYLLIFSAYFFIVYGGVVPYFHNDFDYPTFLIKNRVFRLWLHYFNICLCILLKRFILLLHYYSFCRHHLLNLIFYIIGYGSQLNSCNRNVKI